jgi:hypothetical protein
MNKHVVKHIQGFVSRIELECRQGYILKDIDTPFNNHPICLVQAKDYAFNTFNLYRYTYCVLCNQYLTLRLTGTGTCRYSCYELGINDFNMYKYQSESCLEVARFKATRHPLLSDHQMLVTSSQGSNPPPNTLKTLTQTHNTIQCLLYLRASLINCHLKT